ncbi:hypothetical protein EUGRSUZ_J01218 [Eucalyptus grandis]|uniref:Uncharacterized protein n=2 Tax=Eucalyptus grandis TaxID=71139 RepID=A0ACC3J5A5_EUCGR|nr:hypothetical protein EUGRSUZ_J01218 [Eucalyptus grandis]
MMSIVLSSASSVAVGARVTCLAPETVNWDRCRFVTRKAFLLERIGHVRNKARLLAGCCWETMPRAASSSSVASADYEGAKEVWIWTENKQVMTTAVERGWNTFLFSSQNQGLANEWSSLALINPLFVEEEDILDAEKTRVAVVRKVVSPEDVKKLQPENEQAQIVVIDFADWQVIPAENIVATFQGSQKTVFAISRNLSEAQIFLEALEHGLCGVVLKVEDVNSVLDLKVICFNWYQLICS